MTINKNALLRYQVLDRCFRNSGRKYYWEDLLSDINKALQEYNGSGHTIKRRQLFDDIKFMESEQGWSIPLERYTTGRRVYYRYKDLNYSINNAPLTETERSQIDAAVALLSRFSGSIHFEWVQEMLPVLKDRLGLRTSNKEVISVEGNIDLKGIEFLTTLYESIIDETVLNIGYQDFKSDKPVNLIIHPYFLKQYNNRWFVFGLNHELNIPTWTLALDRIKDIEATRFVYTPSDINWNDYFYDFIGVTKMNEKPVEKVVLEFSSALAPYVLTKPIHPSQKNEWVNDKCRITIKVIPNYELESIIMSFGEHVRVLEPEHMYSKITDRLKKALENNLS